MTDEESKSIITATLNKLRDVQNPEHDPNRKGFCLGSSRFMAGKLIGLFKPEANLRSVHGSAWTSKHGGVVNSKLTWGKLTTEQQFNQTALPAAINDPKAGVQNPDGRWKDIEFHHFYGHTEWADSLLIGRVPLVVGVNYGGGTGADHYITILRSKDLKVWAVDSWARGEEFSVVQLPMDFSFANPQRYKMNVSFYSDGSLIPSSPSYFGHYRDKKSKAAIAISQVI